MNLAEVIKLKFPDVDLMRDVIIQDDGKGPYIKKWVGNDPAPTTEDIASWSNDSVVKVSYLQKQVEDYLRDLINSKPAEKGYDNILTLMSYTNSSNEQWKAEADAFIAWRDSVFEYGYSLLGEVQSGKIQPPSQEEFINNLPALVWP